MSRIRTIIADLATSPDSFESDYPSATKLRIISAYYYQDGLQVASYRVSSNLNPYPLCILDEGITVSPSKLIIPINYFGGTIKLYLTDDAGNNTELGALSLLVEFIP